MVATCTCAWEMPGVSRAAIGGGIFSDWDIATGYMDLPVEQHPKGTAIRFQAHPHLTGRDGGHTIDLRQLALDGVRLHGKVVGADATAVVLADDLAETLDAVDGFCQAEMDGIDAFARKQGLDAPEEDVYCG